MKNCLVAFFAIISIFIANPSAQAESGRMNNRFGFYLAAFGDPFPSLLGINLGINATDFLRFHLGYGSITGTVSSTSAPGQNSNFTITTIGGGAKLLVPDWNFSPLLGIGYSQVTVTASGPSTTNTLYGFTGTATATTGYAAVGFDWQANVGFNLGFGYNWSLLPGVGGLPYAQIGWFF